MIENVKEYFKQFGRENDILEFELSSATVELAAVAAGVIPARIAKTLSFKKDEQTAVLVVTAGDAKIDNRKFKDTFSLKAKMLTPEEVMQFTGHQIGGVCPFALPSDRNVEVYIDESIKRFSTVFPACGSSNSAIELTPDELFKYAAAINWIDCCKLPEITE